MFTILDDGFVRVTGRDGVYRVPDLESRATKRAMRPTEVHPFANVGNDIGAPLVTNRLTTTLSRQSVYSQERLSDTFKALLRGFHVEQLPAAAAITSNIARSYKADAARKLLAEKIPDLFGKLRRPLSDAVDAHIDKLWSARNHLADALRPELPRDPAAALAAAVRGMEVRARVAQMDEPARVRLIHTLGEAGNFSALVSLKDDPLGLSVAPARVLDDAVRAAVSQKGGEFFYAAIDDATEDLETVAVCAELMHTGLVSTLQDAGAPKDMLTAMKCDFQQRANAAINGGM
jgi:hypothetical protein